MKSQGEIEAAICDGITRFNVNFPIFNGSANID
jgi:hypothetical protein